MQEPTSVLSKATLVPWDKPVVSALFARAEMEVAVWEAGLPGLPFGLDDQEAFFASHLSRPGQKWPPSRVTSEKVLREKLMNVL